MANRKLTMRKTMEILRLRYDLGLSMRQVAQGAGVSLGTVDRVLRRLREAGLSWPLPAAVDEAGLDGLLYQTPARSRRHPVDFVRVDRELRRAGVTRQLLWEEYVADADGRPVYRYARFCQLYGQWKAVRDVTLVQTYRAGEKAFVDYSGKTFEIHLAEAGGPRKAELFVGAMGLSNYTYAEATWTQRIEDWLSSHTRMVEYFGGVPVAIVPDNLRSGVSKACRYDPERNVSYRQWAEHYRVAILPARPHRPTDKSKVESAVRTAQNWIMARLRDRRHTTLEELNRDIRTLLKDYNERPFQKRSGSRASVFESEDRPALQRLPAQRHEFVRVSTAKVAKDAHIQFERHFYSVPYRHVGQRIEVRATSEVVQLYDRTTWLATHRRRQSDYGRSTDPAHLPHKHTAHLSRDVDYYLGQGRRIGPQTRDWMQRQFDEADHPWLRFRRCQGLLSLQRSYPGARIENACALANQGGLNHLKQIRSILKNQRDRHPTPCRVSPELPQHHENVRGPQHFQ